MIQPNEQQAFHALATVARLAQDEETAKRTDTTGHALVAKIAMYKKAIALRDYASSVHHRAEQDKVDHANNIKSGQRAAAAAVVERKIATVRLEAAELLVSKALGLVQDATAEAIRLREEAALEVPGTPAHAHFWSRAQRAICVQESADRAYAIAKDILAREQPTPPMTLVCVDVKVAPVAPTPIALADSKATASSRALYDATVQENAAVMDTGTVAEIMKAFQQEDALYADVVALEQEDARLADLAATQD
jgi:hypothetical protein